MNDDELNVHSPFFDASADRDATSDRKGLQADIEGLKLEAGDSQEIIDDIRADRIRLRTEIDRLKVERDKERDLRRSWRMKMYSMQPVVEAAVALRDCVDDPSDVLVAIDAAVDAMRGRQNKNMKPPIEFPTIRMLMTPKDTNNDGVVFGGVMLSLMDQAAYIEAMRQANYRYLTASFGKITFIQPVFSGDVLTVFAKTKEIKKTSMVVLVYANVLRQQTGLDIAATSMAEVLYVAVDEKNNPTPINP